MNKFNSFSALEYSKAMNLTENIYRSYLLTLSIPRFLLRPWSEFIEDELMEES